MNVLLVVFLVTIGEGIHMRVMEEGFVSISPGKTLRYMKNKIVSQVFNLHHINSLTAQPPDSHFI